MALRFALSLLLSVLFSVSLHASCVEGVSAKLMMHNLSIDEGFTYDYEDYKNWVKNELGSGDSLSFGSSSYNNHLLMLTVRDDWHELETFICEVDGGIQIVIKRYSDDSWRKTYDIQCKKEITIKTRYDGVYPVGAVAYCN